MSFSRVLEIIESWPGYRQYLANLGIQTAEVKKLSDLPVLDKAALNRLVSSIPLFNVRSIIPSSGTTGRSTSFGLFCDSELEASGSAIEMYLRWHFETHQRKTLILNLLPGAISIGAPSVTVAAIGTRTDTAIDAILAFGSHFEQIILVGEPIFIKALVEEGASAISWRHLPLYIIIGGDWISESFRVYLETLVGPNRIVSSMGTSELGLNYFFETDETCLLRRLMMEDRKLCRAIIGIEDYIPMLFEFESERMIVESVERPGCNDRAILLTTLEKGRTVPLIRYELGDRGVLLQRGQIASVLKSEGYGELIQKKGTPIIAHFGRGVNIQGASPEKVKEMLYESPAIAYVTTGQFIISTDSIRPSIKIQLKKDIQITNKLRDTFEEAFEALAATVMPLSFSDYPIPLSYERKVRHVIALQSCHV